MVRWVIVLVMPSGRQLVAVDADGYFGLVPVPEDRSMVKNLLSFDNRGAAAKWLKEFIDVNPEHAGDIIKMRPKFVPCQVAQ